MSLTPSAFAAACAPFFTTDQNDPSSLWVTIANFRLLPWVRSTFAGLLLVDDPPLELELVLLLDPPPQPAANALRASTTSSPRLPSSLFMVLKPLLLREPDWSGTRCFSQHRAPARHHPAAPAR